MYYIFQRACVHWFTWRKVFFSLQTRYRPDELKTWHQQLNTSPKISPPTCSRTFLYTLRKWRMKWTWALHSHYSPWTVMTHWLMWFHLSDVTPAIHFFFFFLTGLSSKVESFIWSRFQWLIEHCYCSIPRTLPSCACQNQSGYSHTLSLSLQGVLGGKMVTADNEVNACEKFEYLLWGWCKTESDHWGNRWCWSVVMSVMPFNEPAQLWMF